MSRPDSFADDESDKLADPLVAKNLQLTAELDQASADLSGNNEAEDKLSLRKREIFASNALMLEMLEQFVGMQGTDLFPQSPEQQDEKNWGSDLPLTARLFLAKTLPHLLRRNEIGDDGEIKPLSGEKREALTRQALFGWNLFTAAISGREIDLNTPGSTGNVDQIMERAKTRHKSP